MSPFAGLPPSDYRDRPFVVGRRVPDTVAGEAMHTGEQVLQAAHAFDPARFAGVVFNRLP